jgi:hypothetical protein
MCRRPILRFFHIAVYFEIVLYEGLYGWGGGGGGGDIVNSHLPAQEVGGVVRGQSEFISPATHPPRAPPPFLYEIFKIHRQVWIFLPAARSY